MGDQHQRKRDAQHARSRRSEVSDQADLRGAEPQCEFPLSPATILRLQRTIGNRAVQRLIAQTNPQAPLRAGTLLPLQRRDGNATVPQMQTQPDGIQRQPNDPTATAHTKTWEYEEQHQGQTTMLRTTKIEADAWGEVGPIPPRIKYRREVEMQTPEGAKVYLDIRGTVYLPEGTELPSTPEAALEMAGRLVVSQRTFTVEGGDFVPVNEYKRHEVPGLSFLTITTANFPVYARLPLTVQQQEKAILRHLAKLKRREKEKAEEEGSLLDTAIAIGTDIAPITGELKDAYRAITGIDPDTKQKLSWWERAWAGLSAIPFVGKLFKGIGKGIKGLVRAGRFLGEKFGKFKRWIAGKLGRKKKRLGGGGPIKTGTVWDKINPTGPMRPNTAIPQYFELQTSTGKFFVNTNGTKHMEELVVGAPFSKPQIGKPQGKVSHSVEMRSQAVLTSFAEAMEQASKQGIRYGEIMNIGPWELIIEKTGKSGPLPVVKHAVARGL